MPWTVYNSDGQILQGSSALADDSVNSQHYIDGSIDNAHLADDAVGADELAANAVVNASIASGAAIDATKIADGSVTSTEFQYINTLSSNVQTQLAAKQATIDASARLDAASIGANGNVSNTEYGYLSGVTSDIQTQISAAGGAITREGGQTSEATSTSTSNADVLTSSTLSIAAGEPFYFNHGARKTTGGTHEAATGWDLNGTAIKNPELGVLNDSTWASTSTNEAQTGPSHQWVTSRVTNYQTGILGFTRGVQADGDAINASFTGKLTEDALIPIATLTALIIVGIVANAAITLGIDELHVYSWVAS